MGDIWDSISGLDDDDDAEKKNLDDVYVDVNVVLGRTEMPIHELLRQGKGAVIPLDSNEDDDVFLYIGLTAVAQGQLMLNGERIEISVTKAHNRPALHRPPSDPFRQKNSDEVPQ